MSVCTYDNPATMARECWQDGELLCSYIYQLFYMRDFPVPRGFFFFGANIGPWIPGQLVGDKSAMEVDYEQSKRG